MQRRRAALLGRAEYVNALQSLSNYKFNSYPLNFTVVSLPSVFYGLFCLDSCKYFQI